MSHEVLFIVRLAHVADVSWLGEVVTISFVPLPALVNARHDDRQVLLNTAFPYVFRLATVLGGITVASGVVLLLWYTRPNPLASFGTTWGWLIFAGGTIGAALYAFHLFEESGAERSIAAHLAFTLDSDDPKEVQRLLEHLAFFPRAGMLVLIAVIGLMVGAAHFA